MSSAIPAPVPSVRVINGVAVIPAIATSEALPSSGVAAGALAWVVDVEQFWSFDGTSWNALSSGGGGSDIVDGVLTIPPGTSGDASIETTVDLTFSAQIAPEGEAYIFDATNAFGGDWEGHTVWTREGTPVARLFATGAFQIGSIEEGLLPDPSGREGVLVWDYTNKQVLYSDGVDWVPVSSGGGGGGASDAVDVVLAAVTGLTATDVQAAIEELAPVLAGLSTHIADTSTHGVSGDVVGTTDTQTLSNKTFSTVINSTVASGGKAMEMVSGARVYFDSSRYLHSSSGYIKCEGYFYAPLMAVDAGGFAGISTQGTGRLRQTGGGDNNSSSVGVSTGSKNNFTAAGSLLHRFDNNDVAKSGINHLGEYEGLDAGTGIVLKSADGTRWRVTVSNAGALVVAAA